MNDSPLRLVCPHPFERLLLAKVLAAGVAALRRAGDHELADPHAARAAGFERALR
jgi:hypothetical protein